MNYVIVLYIISFLLYYLVLFVFVLDIFGGLYLRKYMCPSITRAQALHADLNMLHPG
jgi:hypothetical protein